MKKIIRDKQYDNNLIWRISKEKASNFEKEYNDYSKYIFSSDSQKLFDISILNEYPEYLANWAWVITNTGLILFYKDDETKEVLYDMFSSDNTSIQDIAPDISMMLQYNFIDQPLNVRKVSFQDNNFLPDLKYKYNKWYYYLNCDGLEINKLPITTINDNFYFEIGSSESDITGVYFDYKPIFVFKVYDSNGGKITNAQIKINDNNTIVKPYQNNDNIYIADLSVLKEDKIKVSIVGTGFMEVI